ncbi:MAG: PEGA domain-containing protein [Myxococcota bacterium]
MSPSSRFLFVGIAKAIVLFEVLAIMAIGGVLVGGRSVRPAESAVSDPGRAPSAEQAVLKVFVSPEDAILTIDGRRLAFPVGERGVYVPVASGGTIKLRAQKDGYTTLERVVMAPQNGVLIETLNLQKNPASQTAAKAGATPEQKKAPEPKEAKPEQEKVDVPPPSPSRPTRVARNRVAPNDKASRSSRKERLDSRRATLVLEFAPSDAAVVVDGKQLAGSSPLKIDKLSAGSHKVLVKADGYQSLKRTVEFRRGEQVHMSVFLARKPPPPPAAELLPSKAVAAAAKVKAEPSKDVPALPSLPPASPPPPPPPPTSEQASVLQQALASLPGGRDRFRVAVVHAPGRSETLEIRALKADVGRPGIDVRLTMVPYKSIASLTKVMDRGKFDALYVDGTLKRATTSILQVSRARKVVSIGSGRAMTRSGASMGLVRGDGEQIKRLYVSERALRVECCRIPSKLRKLASVVD